MARVGVGNIIGFGGKILHTFKEFGKTLGWTVPLSSDGLTAFVGDGITTHSAANGTVGNLSNAGAWFVMQDPATQRSWLFQRGTGTTSTLTDHQWRFKVSMNFFTFSGGTALVPATATEEQVILGGGTDAAPTFETMFGAGDVENNGWFVFDDTQVNGVWLFWCGSYKASWQQITGSFCLGPLMAGSYYPLDPDPCLYYVNVSNSNVERWSWWHGYGTASQFWFQPPMSGGLIPRPLTGASTGVSVYGAGTEGPMFAVTNDAVGFDKKKGQPLLQYYRGARTQNAPINALDADGNTWCEFTAGSCAPMPTGYYPR